jgi:hypothetical protein
MLVAQAEDTVGDMRGGHFERSREGFCFKLGARLPAERAAGTTLPNVGMSADRVSASPNPVGLLSH